MPQSVKFSVLTLLLVLCSSSPSLYTLAEDRQVDISSVENKNILLTLYSATDGLSWNNRTNWFQERSKLCDWSGIICYSDSESDERRIGHIREINLKNNNLVGTLPSILFEIPFLETVNVADNPNLDLDLSGIGKAQYLKGLSISNTDASNIDNIGAAYNLEVLQMNEIGIKGTLPDSLYGMTSLESLQANKNSFSGTISTRIGEMTSLDDLYLSDNELTGQIPSQIGLLTGLQILSMASNAFGGSLPTELNELTNLERLDLQREDGKEKGNGISGSIPAFDNHRKLTEIFLNNQNFDGQLDNDFLLECPTSEKVEVDLRKNQLVGGVPDSLINKQYLSLFLANNKIQTVSPTLYNPSTNQCPDISNWMNGDVATLGCDAFLCPPGTWALEGRSTSDSQCQACGDDATLWGRTTCTGSTTPDNPEGLIFTLQNFYKDLGGENWKNDNGWAKQDEDVCQWFGITCTSNGEVESINLQNNNLNGAFSYSDIFSMRELRILDLSSNSITFDLTDIGNAQKLEILDLSSTGLSSSSLTANIMLELASIPNLSTLALDSNNIGGQLQSEIFLITSLQELSISHNAFTGELPSNLGSLTNLQIFQCSGNKFNGQIPTQIGRLKSLQEFLAGENEFGGSLPTELNELTRLRTVELQQVLATGGIGGSLLPLRNLQQLTSLKLDSNRLTGTLPRNFLSNSRNLNSRIEIGLSFNELEGSLPAEWNRFDKMYVNLAANKITKIADALCDKDNWMDGDVASYDCDAILCPKGTFNSIGRKSDADSKCKNCEVGGNYLGATGCGQASESDGFNGGGFDDPDASDLSILSEFHASTGGTSWTNDDGWGDTTDSCDWYGITCDSSKRVISIDLSDNNLKGSVPESIFDLDYIRDINLSKNEVRISFASIGRATKLESLDLGETNVASINGIANASKLVSLKLNGNNLEGAFPVSLYSLTSLQELNLGYNQLSGKVPNAIAALTGLTTLHLYHNQFTGRIPAGLGDLTRLRELNLAENNFEGTIPEALNDLTDLRFLSLQREGGIVGKEDVGVLQAASSVLGPGLSGTLPALDRLSSISELYLGVNSLTGPIPFNFLDGVAEKGALLTVDLSSNQISGTLPGTLTQFDRMDLFVIDNLVTGIADGLCLKSDWLGGDVGRFKCDGILCPAGQYSPRLGRTTDSSNVCKMCSSGTDNYMGSAECLTPIEKKEREQRAILEALYEDLGGAGWLENSGWMDDDESICNWFGIECVSDDNPEVISIDLESNNLQNTLPTEVFKLAKLQTLNLEGNMIQVSLNGIENAYALESLDLEETGITSVAGISGATSLKNLRIGKNKLSSLPTEVFNLANLEVLDMSNNPFQAQAMPSGFQRLTRLVHLGCIACGFTGSLPSWIRSMSKLEHLGLGQNGFSQSLDVQLLTLTRLKHLDLSNQKADGAGLSGNLPDFSQHTQLTELYLHNNEFSGTIPTTFLQNAPNDQLITIDLRYNRIVGKVPTELARFSEVNIYLARNEISELPQELCKSKWNEGNPATHGCEGILCNVGYFNAYGRAIGDLKCQKCDDASDFLGMTYCGFDVDHAVLIDFYKATGGPNWKSNENWLNEADHCTWTGITCHEDGDFKGLVKGVSLPDNNLVGSVPPHFFPILDAIESFDVEKNDIQVSFMMVMGAPRLESINVSETNTNSLAGIAGASALKHLHATNAKLTGSIPLELFSLTSLENLYLSHNELGGTIPTNIGDLRRLQNLYMFDNKLTGDLPIELGYLEMLKALSLGENRFQGTIPPPLMVLPLLEILSLQKEQDPKCDSMFCVINGPGFTGSIPAFNFLPQLKELYLAHNKFSGSIPSNFLQGIRDKSNRILADLSYNIIEGTIPRQLADFEDLQLNLASNLIDGIADELCEKTEWYGGEVANGCDAILCSQGTYNEYGRRIDAKTPCEECTYPGSATRYGSTECGPVFVDNISDRKKLFELFDATDGFNWKNKYGWLKENINECDWHGVTCEPVGQYGTMVITELNLSNNNLNGVIPSLLFHMTDLRKLDVRYNDVEMRFYAIYRSNTLEELLLDETRVPTLNGIGRATQLKSLHLSNVTLGWEQIPDDLFDIQSLTDLDLSNSMLGGTLSTKIGGMTNLKHLSLAENGLTGSIPSEIGLLASLEDLSLSNNYWVGKLPETINDLNSLKSFHLDNSNENKAGLSGNLLSFSAMPNLIELRLSDNQLTGTIPGDFLASASADSTINVYLEKNHLVGTIPATLAALSKLNIYLTDNQITGIGDGLCNQDSWLDGAVYAFDCDGILCPPGKYNSKGRQDIQNNICKYCPGVEDSNVFGSSFCLSAERAQEKQILEKLYDSTDGKEWHNSDMWKDDAFDYCDWHGITCSSDSIVESIILGSNHLVGTVPTEIFQLSGLRNLWLYSNPIDFSFVGIDQATNLRSLVLDSTKLKSLDGIGKAARLKDLDIRFNNLGGRFPAEIGELTKLETLACSDNAFTGLVPEMTSVRTLKILRMSNNKFSGALPSFSRHPVLESLDLSSNKLEGTIPSTLLGATKTDLNIYLDFSENKLRGEIPSELSRFSDMTLLLRNNLIEEIPPELCSQTSWNGGDVGNFGCDGLLCPPGTISTFGRASRKLDAECVSCKSSHFGQTYCASAAMFGLKTIILLSGSIITITSFLL